MLQNSTALSLTEAEYIALTATALDMIWCRTLLAEMGFAMKVASIIFKDNDSTTSIASSYKQHSGINHIEIKEHFIRDRVLEVKDIAQEQKASAKMVADLLTKQLPLGLSYD